jgi:hypothetical protein
VAACFGLFGDSANLDARWVHGLRERSIGSKIVLDTPDRTPRCRGSMESHFGLFGDSVSIGAR